MFPCISFLIALSCYIFIFLFVYYYYYNDNDEEKMNNKNNVRFYSFVILFGWWAISIIIWFMSPRSCYWIVSSVLTNCDGYPGCPYYHEVIGRSFWGYHTDTLNIYNNFKNLRQ